MAKKAFNKSKAEMKKAADSLEAVGSFITEDDDDEIEVFPTEFCQVDAIGHAFGARQIGVIEDFVV